MKESFWGLFVIVLGLIGLSVFNVMQSVTLTNENNYYLLKEVTEASMLDAVDLGHYRRVGELKIIEEKFVENFMRRFSAVYGRNETYTVRIFEVIEMPPKVSVVLTVRKYVQIYNYEGTDFNITNRVDAILETKY